MTGTPLAATDLSREILDKALGKQPRESDPDRPASLAERVQDAIDQGAGLDWIQWRFHLSESELRDYCSDLIDDGLDEPTQDSGTGY